MTYLSLGIVGHGAVALGHVVALMALPEARVVAILGRDRSRADAFGRRFDALGHSDVEAFARGLDVAIVASPTPDHATQAVQLLRLGVDTVIELPIASNADELATITATAAESGAKVLATHTARYLPATRLVCSVLDGRLGTIQRVTIERRVAARDRSWPDDPLLHHGQHAIDLLDLWFGGLDCRGAAMAPDEGAVAIVGALPNGAPASVSIVHGAADDAMRVEVLGTGGWLMTDGFGAARGSPGLSLNGWHDRTAEESYLAAIAAQDAAIVAALQSRGSYPAIDVSRRNLDVVERARRLASRG